MIIQLASPLGKLVLRHGTLGYVAMLAACDNVIERIVTSCVYSVKTVVNVRAVELRLCLYGEWFCTAVTTILLCEAAHIVSGKLEYPTLFSGRFLIAMDNAAEGGFSYGESNRLPLILFC
jgi:hypothetical protein